jgi:hypothetical protein
MIVTGKAPANLSSLKKLYQKIAPETGVISAWPIRRCGNGAPTAPELQSVLHLPSAPSRLVPLSCWFFDLFYRLMHRRVRDAYYVECSHLGYESVIRNLSITEGTVLWALSDPQYHT